MRCSLSVLALSLCAVAFAGTPRGGWGKIPNEGRVVKVYDGDTLTLESGDKIRLRWINTPELRPREAFGDEAKAHATRLVLGSTVQLIVSPEGRDGYGRVLAGVRLGETDLTRSLLEEGLGHVFVIPPEDHDIAPLIAVQAKARKARRGIWSLEEYQHDLHITSFHANGRGDDEADPNVEYMRIANLSDQEVDLSEWSIATRHGQKFSLPTLFVPPGHTVMVYSGMGAEQPNPLRQLTAYLGSRTALWDDDGDTVVLIAPGGAEAQRRSSK